MSTKKLPHPKKARERAGLRQVDVACHAGVSIQTVIRCEAGARYPRQEAARRAYLAALGLGEAQP
jgi:DNA-binding XRE family transcriptional regulator